MKKDYLCHTCGTVVKTVVRGPYVTTYCDAWKKAICSVRLKFTKQQLALIRKTWRENGVHDMGLLAIQPLLTPYYIEPSIKVDFLTVEFSRKLAAFLKKHK